MSNQRVALLPLVIGLLVAGYTAQRRIAAERAYDRVDLVADYGEVRALAAYAGLTVASCLDTLREAGLSAVAVEEPTVEELVAAGVLRVVVTPGTAEVTLAGAPTAQANAAVAALRRKFRAPASEPMVRLDAPWPAVALSGGGLDPTAFEAVRRAGLAPVARLRDSPGLSAAAVDAALDDAALLGARTVIFTGDRVLGNRELVDETARRMIADQLAWGRVEFARQRGEARLAEALVAKHAGSYARVHSITDGEMGRISPAIAIERYRRAAKERNIRLCYVRLLLDPAADPLAVNRDYLGRIAAELRRSGFRIGGAEALPRFELGRSRLGVGLFGVCAATAWLLVLLVGWSPARWLGYWLILGVATTVVGFAAPDLYAKVMALLAGLVFPTLGLRWAWLRVGERRPTGLPATLAALWGAAAWSVMGGLMVVGLLSETSYLLAHDIFAGVKLTQVGPLAAAGLLVATGLTVPGVGADEVRRRWREFWSSPVRAAHVAAAFLALLAVAILLLRSGNEGAEIPEIELRFRALLETIFGARPRTKEFLLGHPALLLSALAALRGRREWVAPLFLVGAVGVVSTFNTFCHLHTPLTQSLLRTFHALWLGSAIGLALYAVSGWRRGASGE